MRTPSTHASRSALTRRWLPLAALMVAAMLFATPAQAQFGIAAGLNFESTDDIRASGTSQEAALDNSTGYHIGLVYDLGLGPVNLRPGVIYRRIGDYQFPSGLQDELTDQTLSTIEVPLDLRLTVLPLPILKPYLLAGPMASFPIASDELGELTEDVSLSGNIGVGATIDIPKFVTLQPELRYEFGLTPYIGDEAEIGGQSFNVENEPKFSAFSVRVHVLF